MEEAIVVDCNKYIITHFPDWCVSSPIGEMSNYNFFCLLWYDKLSYSYLSYQHVLFKIVTKMENWFLALITRQSAVLCFNIGFPLPIWDGGETHSEAAIGVISTYIFIFSSDFQV